MACVILVVELFMFMRMAWIVYHGVTHLHLESPEKDTRLPWCCKCLQPKGLGSWRHRAESQRIRHYKPKCVFWMCCCCLKSQSQSKAEDGDSPTFSYQLHLQKQHPQKRLSIAFVTKNWLGLSPGEKEKFEQLQKDNDMKTHEMAQAGLAFLGMYGALFNDNGVWTEQFFQLAQTFVSVLALVGVSLTQHSQFAEAAGFIISESLMLGLLLFRPPGLETLDKIGQPLIAALQIISMSACVCAAYDISFMANVISVSTC